MANSSFLRGIRFQQGGLRMYPRIPVAEQTVEQGLSLTGRCVGTEASCLADKIVKKYFRSHSHCFAYVPLNLALTITSSKFCKRFQVLFAAERRVFGWVGDEDWITAVIINQWMRTDKGTFCQNRWILHFFLFADFRLKWAFVVFKYNMRKARSSHRQKRQMSMTSFLEVSVQTAAEE